MGSFEAPKTQGLEASHPRRPFRLDGQAHTAGATRFEWSPSIAWCRAHLRSV